MTLQWGLWGASGPRVGQVPGLLLSRPRLGGGCPGSTCPYLGAGAVPQGSGTHLALLATAHLWLPALRMPPPERGGGRAPCTPQTCALSARYTINSAFWYFRNDLFILR